MDQNGTYEVVAGDFDGNGASDIFWYRPGTATDAVWFGTGTRGSWVSKPQVVTPTYDRLVPGDFDGDGKDDVAFYASGGADVVWWGAFASSFGPTGSKAVTLGAGGSPFAGDFDGDGKDDLFAYLPGAVGDTVWWGASRSGFGTDAAEIGLSSSVTPSVTATYRYDVDGLRAGKTVGPTSTQFTWGAGGGVPLLLGEHVGGASTWLVYGPGGAPIEQIGADGSVGWLHRDQLGSVRMVTDASGAKVSSRRWDAYGRQLEPGATVDGSCFMNLAASALGGMGTAVGGAAAPLMAERFGGLGGAAYANAAALSAAGAIFGAPGVGGYMNRRDGRTRSGSSGGGC